MPEMFGQFCRVLRMRLVGVWLGAIAILGVSVVAAAAHVTASAPTSPSAATFQYRLGSGDQLDVTVYGESDLSGTFSVDGSGNVRLPLIDQVHAGGLTIPQFEKAVENKLAPDYLLNPRVSVEVTNYRPFTILGEVNKPGEYPYENGMTALNAVALAGGYTYRADQDTVYIERKGSTKENEYPANDKTLVFPGDTVRIAESIF